MSNEQAGQSDLNADPPEGENYRVIYGATWEDAKMILAFLAPYHASGDFPPGNPGKALQAIGEVIGTGAAIMVVKDMVILGSVGMIPGEYWYSDKPLMLDRWLYIHPLHRDGKVLRLLLAEVAHVAMIAGADAQITVNNPRRRRGARSAVEKIASVLRYEVGGSIIRPGGNHGRLQ